MLERIIHGQRKNNDSGLIERGAWRSEGIETISFNAFSSAWLGARIFPGVRSRTSVGRPGLSTVEGPLPGTGPLPKLWRAFAERSTLLPTAESGFFRSRRVGRARLQLIIK